MMIYNDPNSFEMSEKIYNLDEIAIDWFEIHELNWKVYEKLRYMVWKFCNEEIIPVDTYFTDLKEMNQC